jgi:hypothetical protein
MKEAKLINAVEKFADMFLEMSKRWKDKLPGGLADKDAPSDFDLEQLEKGIKVEMEHTDDPEVSTEIAMDHLKEDQEENPDGEETYYDRLEKIDPHHS